MVSVPRLLIIAERGYCPSTQAWIETIQCILDSLKRYPNATLQIRNKYDDDAWKEIDPMLNHWFSTHSTQLQLNGLHQPHRYCMRHLPETNIHHAFDRRPTVLGTSIHSTEALRKAEEQSVDYVQYGAIFPTSKPVRPLGLNALHKICQQTSLPVLAVGGISSPHHIEACLNSGAYGVSIGSWILQSTDIPATLERIVNTLL